MECLMSNLQVRRLPTPSPKKPPMWLTLVVYGIWPSKVHCWHIYINSNQPEHFHLRRGAHLECIKAVKFPFEHQLPKLENQPPRNDGTWSNSIFFFIKNYLRRFTSSSFGWCFIVPLVAGSPARLVQRARTCSPWNKGSCWLLSSAKPVCDFRH